MANVYVYSGAGGAGTGADWTNAYTTLVAACAAKAAGDVFYVAHDHAETSGASITITSPGTDTTSCRVYCVDRTGSVPPVSADLRDTATIVTTASTANITFAGGFSEINGLRIDAGQSGTGTTNILLGATANRFTRVVNCRLKLSSTGTTSRISCNNTINGAACTLENTTVEFSAVAQGITSNARTIWRNTPNAIQGAVIPTTLCLLSGGATWFLEGLDLSAMGSGKAIFANATAAPTQGIVKDCKLGASSSIIGGSPASVGCVEVYVIRSDSGDTNYRTEKYTFAGTLTAETAVVRSGGATDGTTPISWKIVTTANSEIEMPLETLPISIWNETVGSAITVTAYATKASGLPTNGDIWINVQYLGTSGFPLAAKATCGKADGLATATTYSSDGSTWSGGLSSPGVFAMSVTITPQEKGPITVYVLAALASTTFYVDPKLVIS